MIGLKIAAIAVACVTVCGLIAYFCCDGIVCGIGCDDDDDGYEDEDQE